jgi:DNA (cytosine-5)-methyltransferase 1
MIKNELENLNYLNKTRDDLILICKEKSIKGYSGKKKADILKLLKENKEIHIKITTLPLLNRLSLKMVDLFAGTGAFTLAFEQTGCVDIVFSNDMISHSKKIYDENFDHKLTLKDLNEVNNEDIHPYDILTAGFPCFIKGTLTLTNNGYKNIEDVKITDKLLTHNRKFQKIKNLQRKIYTGKLFDIKIKYHPELITTTEEHPFYIREKKGNNFGNPIWKKANEITMNDYFGMVINSNEIIPEFTFEETTNQYKTEKKHIKLDKLDYWFVMGYLVGDGWIEETTKEDRRCMYKIRFAINSKDEDEVFERINKVIPITDKKCDTGDKCKKFGCSNIIWYNILKHFGKYAHGKLIPEWVQDAPKEFIQEFINGYMKADGCINNNKILQITTVSSNLAYGLQRLYLKLGHIFSINKCIRPKTTVIEGRTVNQRDTYCIRGTLQKERKISSFIEDNYVWFAPFKIIKREITEIPVYNFEVENDNSYIVMNTIVHNCQPFSIAGLREGFDDERSNVFWKILSIIDFHHPKCIILENVKNLISHDETKTFNTIKTNLEQRGYFLCYKVLNTSDITGIPHHRERIYIVCIKSKKVFDSFSLDFPKIEKKKIGEFLEKDVASKYYYTDKSSTWELLKDKVVKKDTVYQYRRVYVRENKSNECPTLTANMGTGGHNVPIIMDDIGIRKLTPRECFNLQGFPLSYKLPALADSNLYKLAGNAVSVPVVKLIADRIIPLLKDLD